MADNKRTYHIADLTFPQYGEHEPVAVYVDSTGKFFAEVNEVGFEADSLDHLKRQVQAYLHTATTELPIVRMNDGRVGVARGVHQGNGDILVTWEDGEKGRLSSHEKVGRPEDFTSEQIAAMRAEAEALAMAIESGNRKRYERMAQGEDVRTLYAAAVGQDLLDPRAEVNDLDAPIAPLG